MTSTPLKTSDISLIIPTFNEEDNIIALAANLAGGDHEVIVVDGGSSDNTVALAQEQGLNVLESEAGRAVQLNHGALTATGKILVFLHADTRLPPDFSDFVLNAVSQRDHIAGAFKLAIIQPTTGMRFVAWFANLRSLIFRLPYGDQAIFLLRDTFMELGMFPLLPVMEDYVFIQKAKKQGEIVLVDSYVSTSARRWKRLGVIRTTLINQIMIIGFYCKIPPDKLASLYRR